MARAYFARFSIRLSLVDAMNCSHQGACDDDVAHVVRKRYVQKQFDEIPDEMVREELREYGAWDASELADELANRERMLWIAACNIREERAARKA